MVDGCQLRLLLLAASCTKRKLFSELIFMLTCNILCDDLLIDNDIFAVSKHKDQQPNKHGRSATNSNQTLIILIT